MFAFKATLLWALCGTAHAFDGDITTASVEELLNGWTPPPAGFPANDPWALPLINGCPISCSSAGADSANWTQLYDRDHLALCDKPLLFKFNVHNEPSKFPTIRACAVSDAAETSSPNKRAEAMAAVAVAAKCGAGEATVQVPIRAGAGALSGQTRTDAAAAVDILVTQLASNVECGSTILFARSGTAVVGLYAGADVKKDRAAQLLAKYKDAVRDGSESLEICDESAKTATTLGVFAISSVDEMDKAQKALSTWSSGSCLSTEGRILDASAEFGVLQSTVTSSNSTVSNSTLPNEKRLSARSDCWPMQVHSGDGCASMASHCGCTPADFSKYNDPKICSSLKPGQWVCCTPGTMPDMTPQPQKDGSCRVGTVHAGDGCWALTDRYGISEQQLNDWNKDTWGWAGCGNLQQDQVFCTSPGSPPMPAPLEGAMCGPQMPGTRKLTPPFGIKDMAKLNLCPLNACCGGWGFCGTTAEFCTEAPASAGNLGAHPPGVSGCISNCGMDVVIGDYPASRFKIGYFQGYNLNKKCGTVDIRSLDVRQYTHIHFAFATLTPGTYQVDISPVVNQFYYFKQIKGTKKILSFGGWTFSTDPATYGIFRTGVKAEHRETMAANIAKFVIDNDLDGVDIDWEYPAAPDIPGIPAADPDQGLDYLMFMIMLRGHLGKGKSISFAAPASYWYLRGFPIAAISYIVDYIVYMTYDLHGQWDYKNKWTDPGCGGGNCLRSHVNLTETLNALSMITKAGVPSNKVAVGITSYGRSFKMTTPGCTGPMCTYVGPESQAAKGPCTDTAGFIGQNEIDDIIKNNPSAKVSTDNAGGSILVYNDVEWVSYLDDQQKKVRDAIYNIYHFLGTSDWAIDMGSVSTTVPISNSKWHGGEGLSEFKGAHGSAKVFIHRTCQEGDREAKIAQGWKDAGQLTVAFLRWRRDNKYQRVMDNYMGPHSRETLYFYDHLWDNLINMNDIHFGTIPHFNDPEPTDVRIYFYCEGRSLPQDVLKEQAAQCVRPDTRNPEKNVTIAAKTFRYPAGRTGSTSHYYILFCPGYLGEQSDLYAQFEDLDEVADQADHSESVKMTLKRWASGIRGVTMFHELMHFQDVSRGKWNCGLIEYYSTKQMVLNARARVRDQYEENLKNAHSWAVSSVLMWAMDRWPSLGVILPPGFKDVPIKDPTRRAVDAAADAVGFDEMVNGTYLELAARDDDDEDINTESAPPDSPFFEPSRVDPSEFTYLDTSKERMDNFPCINGLYENKFQCQLSCANTECTVGKEGPWRCACNTITPCPGGKVFDTNEACAGQCTTGTCNHTSDNKFVCLCVIPGPP